MLTRIDKRGSGTPTESAGKRPGSVQDVMIWFILQRTAELGAVLNDEAT